MKLTEKQRLKKNEYQRNYYATHPEAREKRKELATQWHVNNRERYNNYQRKYQYNKRMKEAKEKFEKEQENNV